MSVAEEDEPDEMPAGTKNYVTPRGFRMIEEELSQLRRVERPKVVEVVSWAAGNGDRSENGDYIYGKKRLREIDRRIRYLIKRHESAEVVEWLTGADGEIGEIALRLADGRAAVGRVLTRVPVYRVIRETIVKVTFGTAAVVPRDGATSRGQPLRAPRAGGMAGGVHESRGARRGAGDARAVLPDQRALAPDLPPGRARLGRPVPRRRDRDVLRDAPRLRRGRVCRARRRLVPLPHRPRRPRTGQLRP